MSKTTALTVTAGGKLAGADPLADLSQSLRLHPVEGDASPHTIRSYLAGARAFVAWCLDAGIEPARASEGDVIRYRAALVGVKLAAVRRLFEALRWRDLRRDNPDGAGRADQVSALGRPAAPARGARGHRAASREGPGHAGLDGRAWAPSFGGGGPGLGRRDGPARGQGLQGPDDLSHRTCARNS